MALSGTAGGGGEGTSLRLRLGLPLGAALFVGMLLLPPPAGMEAAAWRVAATGALMAVWWVSEAIPIAATALVPLVAFPLLGVAPIGGAAAPYANPIIFLFLGGFLLAAAMQRSGLHRRIALGVVSGVGTGARTLILGFMVATALLSMWVSNTATAVMMLPIGTSVIALMGESDDAASASFATALMLAVAYGASIGGLGTLIGTPPNAFLAGYMSEAYGVEIGFGQWMLVGVPLVVVSLPLSWLLLTRVVFRVPAGEVSGGRDAVRGAMHALGPVRTAERRVAVVFVVTALAWVFRPLLEARLPGLSDTGIAVAAALILFMVPAGDGDRLLDWESAEALPWGVLLLFGGGLSLAAAISDTGLAAWIGTALGGLGELPVWVLVLAVTAVIVFLTELTSNTATAAAFLPVLGPLAVSLGQGPLLFTVPAALAASCAFMMPVATPPNAIVYGSGRVTIPEMARAGLWLNVLFILLIQALAYTLVPLVLGP